MSDPNAASRSVPDPSLEPQSFRIPGSHGLSLHGLRWSQEGTPFVMLHGFGNDVHVWEDFAPEVAPYYRTLALDLRGHGDSDRDPEGRYDYPFHVEDLEAATGSLGIERMVLVAHSFGGRVAMLYAAAHPEQMAGLVLVDTGPEFDERGTGRIRSDTSRRRDQSFASVDEYAQLIDRNYSSATRAAKKRLVDNGLRRTEDGRYERKTDPKFYAGREDLSAEEQAKRSKAMTERMWKALESIACPCLVVRGAASDVMSPEIADRMVDTLPNGELALVSQASHSVMLDNPEEFATVLKRFALGEA